MSALLRIERVSKVYPRVGRDTAGGEALKDITLEVTAGEFVAVIGPSGCGKTTLLETVGGLIESTAGAIYVQGEIIHGPHPAIGIVFQEDSTFPWLTTFENVEFGLRMRGLSHAERRRICQDIITLVGLAGFEHHYPRHLSGGMRQRVAIARTLVLGPEILLMDEPFGALDEQTRLLLGDELLRIREQTHATIVFVTHDIGEAVRLADRIVVMTARPGRIKNTIVNDLARPRGADAIADEKFNTVVRRVWMELKEEALKQM